MEKINKNILTNVSKFASLLSSQQQQLKVLIYLKYQLGDTLMWLPAVAARNSSCPLPTWRPVFPFPSFQLSRHSSCFTYGNDILWDQVYFWNSIWQQGNISMVRAGNSRVPFISPCFISSCSTTFTHGNDILWDQVYLWNNIWQQGSTYKHGLCG